MTVTRRDALKQAGTGALAWSLSFPAQSQSYPDKPVKMIVPYPAGGGADSWARTVAARLEKVLGQPVIFDYRPGGSTTIGADAAARAAPDGYTLFLMDSTTFAYVPHLRKVNYDPLRSFVPIGLLGVGPMVLVATPGLPVRSLPELIAYARAHPGKVTIASAGVGSPHHLIGEFFRSRAGINLTHVPYKGASQYIADLLGGQVDLAVSTITPAIPHIQTGRIRALGVSSASRSSALPDVPSIAEQGFPGFDEKPWLCYVTPAGVPADVLEKMRAAYKATIEDPDIVAALRKGGIEEVGAWTPAQIADQIKADHAKWGELIRKANIRLDA